MSNEPLGIVHALQAKARAAAFANPRAHRKIMGEDRPKQRRAPKSKPLFARGRYVAPSATDIIALVARVACVPVSAICGDARHRPIVDARFAIANLSEEFAAQLSAAMVENAMNRGDGIVDYYRERHVDRLALHPEYLALYEGCRAAMLEKHQPAGRDEEPAGGAR